jgi:hypothetical protein
MIQLQRSKDSIGEEQVGLFRSGKLSMQPSEPMPNRILKQNKLEIDREPFVTIDDLVDKAQDLFSGLQDLSERKHPLDIRRGVRKGVMNVADKDRPSKIVKAGAKTYFFDLNDTKDGKPYLIITESRFKGEEGQRERASILVFPEHAEKFSKAVSEMTKKLEI